MLTSKCKAILLQPEGGVWATTEKYSPNPELTGWAPH